MSPNPLQHYSVKFEQRSSKWICIVEVRPAAGITYLKLKSGKGAIEHHIYVRNGNRSIKLVDLERDRFVVERFGGAWTL